jgi:putative nucleotidyltransferase with HDIG domain
MRQKEAQVFLNQISQISHDLPVSPTLLRSVFEKTRTDSRFSLGEIARDLSVDQGLSAKMLALANSAYYGLQSKVSTIDRAVTVLGLRELRTILLVIVVRLLANRIPPDTLDLQNYFDHNFQVAVTAGELGRKAGHPKPDELFTAGLLHDLGILITALYRPDHFRKIEAIVHEQSTTSATAELGYWGIDHGIIGAQLIKSWDLPLSISEPVNWHHSPELSPEFNQETALIALADTLEHIRIGSSWTAAVDLDLLANLAGLEYIQLVPLESQSPNPFLAI